MQNSYKRVDAHLSSLGYCSRSEAKKFLKMFKVSIDDVRVFDVTKKSLSQRYISRKRAS
jgi:16S rRNA uridine-516 pseudouridylate synthase and related pseudouridylate synthases